MAAMVMGVLRSHSSRGCPPSAVSVSVTSSPQTDATNPDGSVSAFASGGTPPYSIYGVMAVLMPLPQGLLLAATLSMFPMPMDVAQVPVLL